MNIFGITSAEAAFAGGLLGSFLITLVAFVFLWYILLVIAGWKIFEKAGQPGWKALIPIYNVYILYKIVGMQGWWWGTIGIAILYGIIATGAGYSPYMTEEQMAAFDFGAHPVFLIATIVTFAIAVWVNVTYAYRTAKVFGHDIGYTIGLILMPDIFRLIIGFGSSQYDKKYFKKHLQK